VDAVKLRHRVLAPDRLKDGTPKDGQQTQIGNFRDTQPSIFWTDITVPALLSLGIDGELEEKLQGV